MPYEWADAFCLALPGAEKDFKQEWNATRYLVGGKMFCMMGGDKQGVPILTLKLEPAYGELLRRQYPGQVVPGYYMNKLHWNSVYYTGPLPDDELKNMLQSSHSLVLASLSQKARKEIAGG